MTTEKPSTSNENVENLILVKFSAPGDSKFLFKEYNPRFLTSKPGSFLQSGAAILRYEERTLNAAPSVVVAKNFKLSDGGVFLSKIGLEKGAELKNGDLILKMRRCDHTTVANDMCAVCGSNLREKDGRPGERALKSEAKFSVVHSEPNLLVACDEARILGGRDEENLLETRRLALLVDLDLTLIHTTDVPVEEGLEDVHSFELSDQQQQQSLQRRHVTYHVRLRPHARQFLARASRLFELHICTFGAREYAHRVARILDPDRSLFGRRILSRDECFDQASKRNNLHFSLATRQLFCLFSAIFPHGDHMALIIDDRDDVWDFAQNMVRVKPYKFFKHTGDINAPPGFEKKDDDDSNSKKKSNYHQDTDDDYLLYLQDILSRLHSEWYKRYDQMKQGLSKVYPNTHEIVPQLRAQTLQGLRLTFSGLVPTQSQSLDHPLYDLARRFGAQISLDLIEQGPSSTTHLVANRQGTAKIKRAQFLDGVEIVNSRWFFISTERWTKLKEDEYRILDEPGRESPPNNWQLANGFANNRDHYSNTPYQIIIDDVVSNQEQQQNSNLKRKLNIDEEEEFESESEYEIDQEEDDQNDDMAAALDAQFKN